jgi:hypothetical protein
MPELGHLDRCPDGVSYGDMVLATVAGKLLGRLVSITGVGTRALFSGASPPAQNSSEPTPAKRDGSIVVPHRHGHRAAG